MSIRGDTRRASLIGTLRYVLTTETTVDLDAFWFQEKRHWWTGGASTVFRMASYGPAPLPSIPGRKDVRLTLPTSAADGWMDALEHGWRLAGGLKWALPREWNIRLSYAWSYSSVAMSRPVLDLDMNAWTFGALNPLAADFDASLRPYVTTWQHSPVRAKTGHAYMLIGGPIIHVHGRPLSASLVLEHRHERSAVGGAVESLRCATRKAFARHQSPNTGGRSQ